MDIFAQSTENEPDNTPYLLAVDAGLHSGWALFSKAGHLLNCREVRFKNRRVLKAQVYKLLNDLKPAILLIEGGGDLADTWMIQAEKNGIQVQQIYAETWRSDLFSPSAYRDRVSAKKEAKQAAAELIKNHHFSFTGTLHNNCAEAILFGHWYFRHR